MATDKLIMTVQLSEIAKEFLELNQNMFGIMKKEFIRLDNELKHQKKTIQRVHQELSLLDGAIPLAIMGDVVDQVFYGAIEDPAVINDIYRVIMRGVLKRVRATLDGTGEKAMTVTVSVKKDSNTTPVTVHVVSKVTGDTMRSRVLQAGEEADFGLASDTTLRIDEGATEGEVKTAEAGKSPEENQAGENAE